MSSKPETLQSKYRLRFENKARYRNQVWKILCQEYFSQFIHPGSDILDIGAGWGEFINNVEATKKYAIDLNPDAEHRLAEDITFFHQDCSHAWPLADESLDIVFTSNFLEHLHDKAAIEQTLAEAYRCLKPNGFIICLGPNIKYVPGAYWDFWDHYVPITELSLAEALKLKGFNIELMLPRFLPYSMSTGMQPPLFLIKWYVKLPVFWPWLGKQFLVIGQKTKKSPADMEMA
jgi:ubiquinone/menaquinone biosynthesis C-methylase UbiE